MTTAAPETTQKARRGAERHNGVPRFVTVGMFAGMVCLPVTAVKVRAQGSPEVRTVVLKPSTACRNCSIRLTREVALRQGGEEQGGFTSAFIRARDSQGRYYVVTAVDMSRILVFDARGRYLQSLGNRGGGPGEFQSVGPVHVGAGDTLHIFDQLARTYTRLTPSYQVAGTTRLGLRVAEALEVKPGIMVLNGRDGTRAGFGYPLRILDQSRLGPPFGGTAALDGASRPQARALNRQFARESSGTFWAAHGNQYRLDLWSTDGSQRRSLVRHADWFNPVDPMTVEGRLNPFINDIQVDSLGLIWTLVWTRPERWRDIIVQRATLSNGLPIIESRTGNRYDMYDSRLEVIDPARGEVIATLHHPRLLQAFVGPGRVFVVERDEFDLETLIVFRVELVPRTNPGR